MVLQKVIYREYRCGDLYDVLATCQKGGEIELREIWGDVAAVFLGMPAKLEAVTTNKVKT